MAEMNITFPGGKRVNAEYRGTVIPTDQSELAGGDGSAPEPFSLFLASIGTCAGIYVLGFCQQRGIPTEGVHLVQRIHRDPEKRMIDRIEIEIRVPPEFPVKYHRALVQSANLCAVKKHIFDPPEFAIATVVEPAPAP